MDVEALLYVIALVLAIVSTVDQRAPWLPASVICVCIGLLLGADLNTR